MDNLENYDPDAQIRQCIDEAISFTVIAGAGAGKTGSLVSALIHIRNTIGKKLRSNGKKVACITYTNVAKEVIKKRTESDELFTVNTIHEFFWSQISRYQSDINKLIRNELIPLRITKKIESGVTGNSQKSIKNRQSIDHLKHALAAITTETKFSYSTSGSRDYAAGKLDHDDIIDISTSLLLKNEALKKIIAQSFPYIMIDEAQDTFSSVVDALNSLSAYNELPVIGYFGDPLQQIYEKRVGSFSGPTGSAIIKKEYNYRCSTEVIKLLNSFRPDLKQIPGPENKKGSVKITLIQSEPGEGPRSTYTIEQLERSLYKFDKAVQGFGWEHDENKKLLFLTRQMIAHRLKFSSLNKVFTGPYSSKSSEDQFKEGSHFLLQPFFDVLIPLIEAKQKNDWQLITSILRSKSPILAPEGINKHVKVRELTAIIDSTINTLLSCWQTHTTREILLIAAGCGLIVLSDRIKYHLTRSNRTESYDEDLHSKEKGDWLADSFLSMGTEELPAFRKFILKMTPYSTQHGVKGDEFKKVIVVFNDTEANWNNYSFTRLLTPSTANQNATENQYSKSRNLAYVCFSRAIEDLRIVLYTENPRSAEKELIESKLFISDQISVLS
jgi:DNA helicase-2/ATP-dependent DNA helicase PcrA